VSWSLRLMAVVALVLGGATAAAATSPEPASEPPTARAEKSERGKSDRGQPIVVDADTLERFGKERLIIFTGNVIARHTDSVQYADRMEVYQNEQEDGLLRTVSTGAVRILMRDGQTGSAARAEYEDLEQRIVLLGRARVWKDDSVVSGDRIVIELPQDHAVVHGGPLQRVKALFYPRQGTGDEVKDGTPAGAATPPPPGTGLLASAVTAAQPPKAQVAPAPDDKSGSRTKEDRGQPVTVDSDKMERFGKESLVIFTGNVVARQNSSVQYADRMEVYLDEKGDRILRTVSTGNVRIITRDCRTGTARRAEYHDLEQRVVLSGNARVWQEDNVVSGESIVIYLSQDRSVVQGGKQERVKAIFYPKDDKDKDKKDGTVTAKAPVQRCAN
jgi:lipopolysaccharide export system protein LptA